MTKATVKKEPRNGRGQHPNSRANLRPQRSDEPSRNPTGKPPGTKDRATVIRKWIETPAQVTNPVTKAKEPGTVEDLMVIGQVTQAVKGNTQAFRELMDSVYGKVPDKHEVGGKGGDPIRHSILIEVLDGGGANQNPDE